MPVSPSPPGVVPRVLLQHEKQPSGPEVVWQKFSGRSTTMSTIAYAKRGKRGGLGEVIQQEQGDVKSALVSKRNRGGKQSSTKNAAGSQQISPDLAKWAAETPDNDSTDSSTTDTPSSRPSNSRRIKQAERQQLDKLQTQNIDRLVQEFNSQVEKEKKNMNDLLKPLIELTQTVENSSSLRSLTRTTGSLRHYRLAWVGSDDAVCQIGTGLHKVPLARLQEVFLSLSLNTIDVTEVIRLLGPFPNVKNQLQGTYRTTNNSKWEIKYDSMIDGTGKEILSAGEQRTVELELVFVSPQIILACTPPENANNNDPLYWTENYAKGLLVLVEEPNLQDKLETLRVA